MRAVWMVIAIVCTIAAGHKPRGDNCCNGDKILDTIQRVIAYGGRKGHSSHRNHFTAFSAYVGSDFTGSHNRQKVVFNSTVTNYGNAYNPKDGVFTCPFDGVYTFDNEVISLHGKSIYARMVLNGSDLNFLSYTNAVSGRAVSASMSAVLQLKKGDRVWIITYQSYTFSSQFSTFSGWLLHEI